MGRTIPISPLFITSLSPAPAAVRPPTPPGTIWSRPETGKGRPWLYAHNKHPPPRCNSGALPQLNSPDGHRATSVVAHICQQCRTKLSWKMQGVTVILAQAPGKPEKTRSIAPNQGYICRSRPHEGGGETKKKTAPRGGGTSKQYFLKFCKVFFVWGDLAALPF